MRHGTKFLPGLFSAFFALGTKPQRNEAQKMTEQRSEGERFVNNHALRDFPLLRRRRQGVEIKVCREHAALVDRLD